MPGKPKGLPKTGGRKKGSVNKATQNARESIAAFVDGNAERLEGWLDQMAQDDPKEAFKCFMSVVEYHIPKLARTETDNTHRNPDGTGVFQGVTFAGIDVKAGTTEQDT